MCVHAAIVAIAAYVGKERYKFVCSRPAVPSPTSLVGVGRGDPALVSRTSDCWYILMNGARNEQERGGCESAVHR
jgi:hypothetical protein